MIETIFDAIKAYLVLVDEIEEVLEYPTDQPTGYPYAWVEYVGDESEILNNQSDRVTYEFRIRLIQEKFEDIKGRANAEETTRDRAYTISEKFRANNNLNTGTVLKMRPIRTEKEYVQGATRIQLTITLMVETIETITRSS
jgi:hypothetical protein